MALGAALSAPAVAQNPSPADVAARMTGSWTLNKELSPGLFGPPAGRPGGRGGGALYALAAPQRGGRGAAAVVAAVVAGVVVPHRRT